MTHWTLILIAAGANILLNQCLRQTGRSVNTESLTSIITGLILSPWAWASCLCAAVLLTAFVAVNVRFEAIEGGDMEDVAAVSTVIFETQCKL